MKRQKDLLTALGQQVRFNTAKEAFIFLYDHIKKYGEDRSNTKAVFNIGFYISSPELNEINVEWRKWNKRYADREWEWYKSQNRSVEELKKYAPIWDKMHSGDNIVNSNYGFLWNEKDQLQKVIHQLREDPNTRRAWITIFDGKRKDEFQYDTPCTLSIGFQIIDRRLCMTVLMRSNDLWYGFCNDQYCFSKLQKLVADELEIRTGWYYHFANDLHLYRDVLDRTEDLCG